MSDFVLKAGAARATVASLGAELRSWTVDGSSLIWVPDPAIWDATAPLLFPVVGWTRGGAIRVDGQTYPLGVHGFARSLPFRLVDHEADRLRLVLDSSPETRACYPFDFSLSVLYRLTPAALDVTLEIENTGLGPMAYACGLHPGFAWPFAGGDLEEYAVAFEASESPLVPVISARGLFTRDRRPVPLAGRQLPLSEALFAREALCFLEARSRGLRFFRRDGAAIAIRLEGFPHIALWSRPGGRFLSIEAWTGRGDDEDGDGDLWTKPSMLRLAPGERGRHAAAYAFSRNGAEAPR